MFNPVSHVIEGFLAVLAADIDRAFPLAEPAYRDTLLCNARLALETIATTDAAYHDLEHTIHVTQAGTAMLDGKRLVDGDVTPSDWVHGLLAMLFHDIGYVRGALPWDRAGAYVINEAGEVLAPASGATDACLAPYHVDRAKLLIRHRFMHDPLIGADRLCQLVERTRFPAPDIGDYRVTDDLPGLVRAADLVGQLADPRYTAKQARLFEEFRENGTHTDLGHADAGELRTGYPRFFWNAAMPCMASGIDYLKRTQDGSAWLARLYAHVFCEEHGLWSTGPERAAADPGIRLAS